MAQQIASLYAEIKADTTGLEKGLAATQQGLQKTAANAKSTGSNFTEMASKLNVAQQAFSMTAGAAGQVWSILEQGAALNLAADRFDNLTASIGTTADSLMNDLAGATNGMMSNADMMASASQIISLGLGDNQKDVVDLAGLVSNLGWDMQQVIMTFANNSKMRLDALGLSVEDVEKRAKALEAQGYSTDKAFDLAVIQAGEAKFALLGGAADTTAGAMQRLTVQFENLKTSAQSFIAMRAEGAIVGLANSIDAVGAAGDAGHSDMRNFLVVMNEVFKQSDSQVGAFDGMIASMEGNEQATVDTVAAYANYREALAAGTAAQALAAKGIVFTSEQLSAHMSLESMYGRQHIVIAAQVAEAEAEKQAAIDAYGVSLTQGTGLQDQYGNAAMASAAASNRVADAFFRTAAAAAAEQAALLGTFNSLSQNEDALKDYAVMMGGVRTVSVKVGGATAEQTEEMERLQGIYDKAAGTIRDYEQGLKGVGMSEEQIAENVAEQQTLMTNAQAALEPLVSIQDEYTTATDGGAAAAGMLNEKLFAQIQASSDSAQAIAMAGVALGVYTEEEANAMIKSALLEEMIRKQAEAWDGTAAGLATIQTNIEGYIGILNGIPDAINTTVSTDYQSTGTPPPWAGGPSSGDVGEGEGSWGGEAMASGGMVTGGVPGRDSVPAMLMPGEEVLSVNNPRNSANGGGGATVNIYVSGMAASPQAIAGAVSRVLTPRG